ncbi:glycosyltransferase [Patescibacteria group bacterium]|nr:glycosyltransferase [Patescibacteria group bacterium]
MRIVNLLATYNEKENIGPMIKALDKIADSMPDHEFIHLVVDSRSPDGTGKLVKKMAKGREDIHLLETPRGLGISMIRGYEQAMKKFKAEVVIPNDADFQWDPNYIPDLVKKIEEGYDVAVPSRHVKGGGDSFSFFRKLTHWVSNTLLASYWAGVTEVKDHNGNMKAIRVKGVLDKVDLKKLDVRGYVIQMTIIYELSKTGAKFVEIPAIFKDRRAGVSKVGMSKQFFKDVLEYFKQATKIRLERSARFIKFGMVGFLGYLVNAGGLELFGLLGCPEWAVWALATELAIISNFIWNNLWTFSDQKFTNLNQILAKFLQFNLTSAGALLIQTVAGTLGEVHLGLHRQVLLPLIIVFMVLPYNYLMYTRVIWKTKKRS